MAIRFKLVSQFIFILIPLFLGACSVTAPVYSISRIEDKIVTFEGIATGYFDRTGTIEMEAVGGVKCAGEFRYTGYLIGIANLTCSNGEKATIQFNGLSNTSGYGYGKSTSGYPIAFTYGLDENERKRYLHLGKAFASTSKRSQPKKPKLTLPPATTPPQSVSNTFHTKAINVRFHVSEIRPDDIAVIIGNANYKKLGKDIPNVSPAYADAAGIKRYFMKAKGVREGNIIHLKDATSAQLTGVFGNKENHKGQLFNWVKPAASNVYIYYVGHGAPAGDEGTAYLVPSDATSETVDLTGYPLATLYKNLGKIPAKSITVILEACFSGASQAGSLIPRSSGISVVPRVPVVPKNITVISAGAANQVASWEKDEKHSLFTKYFLKGMSGEGDKKPYGNGDGKVTYKELGKYLEGTMTYFARRYYGRDQKAQIVSGR
jgi:hypothetical protein